MVKLYLCLVLVLFSNILIGSSSKKIENIERFVVLNANAPEYYFNIENEPHIEEESSIRLPYVCCIQRLRRKPKQHLKNQFMIYKIMLARKRKSIAFH